MARRDRPRSMFRGNELSRLGVMICMLVLLVMLIVRAQNPNSWSWLARQKSDDAVADVAKTPQPAAAPAHLPVRPGAKQPASPAAAAARPAPQAAEPNPPLDQDPDELEPFSEEVDSVTDGSLDINKFEMKAYWRLMRWARGSTVEELAKRADNKVMLNDFARDPAAQRGKLFHLELNIRQIISSEAPKDHPPGVKRLYQLVGATDQSQAYLYFLITDQLPPGMPEGVSVHERVGFYGYFLKIQGYHEGGAKPNERPLYAPVLIGRVVWRNPTATPADEVAGWHWWVWVSIAAGAGVVLAVGGGLMFGRRPITSGAAAGSPPQFDRLFSESSEADAVEAADPGENPASLREPAAPAHSDVLTEEQYLALFRRPEPSPQPEPPQQ